MKLDHKLCYLAVKSRDERFDGRFFTGVLTTGIYCRPVCPAKTPRAENVRFFACAAAAEAAGFRPCLRCRPETSPGTPAWLGTSSTVSRALQLISEGTLDEDETGVDDLAHRLGIGARQLRRLFKEHLGASPVAIAQTRRVHFAKKLIDETNLPISQIAFSSGFSSIRRFNHAFRTAYGKTPSELRKDEKQSDAQPEAACLQLKLAYRPPFAWDSLVEFLRARAIPGVESADKVAYRRTICFGSKSGMIEVCPVKDQHHFILKVPMQFAQDVAKIISRVQRLFDLKADPIAIGRCLKNDERLSHYRGLRVPGAWDGFEIAVRAILGQQVSVKGATTLSGRLVELFGQPLTSNPDGLRYLFPTPQKLAQADLTVVGLPQKRAASIQALAKAVCDGRLDFAASIGLEPTIRRLTELPGIGPWTANYIAMRAFGEPDAFLADDLILKRAASENPSEMLSRSELLWRAEAWRPWRAYAAMHLWKTYSDRQQKGKK